MASDNVRATLRAVLAHRLRTGEHLHHRDCIHNLSPEEQARIHGRTPEAYVRLHGSLPVQIGPGDWECESPWRGGDGDGE